MKPLVIEKGIPINTKHDSNRYLILDEMEVGDSVLFEAAEWKKARNQAMYRKPKGFSFRKYRDGYRCWRVA